MCEKLPKLISYTRQGKVEQVTFEIIFSKGLHLYLLLLLWLKMPQKKRKVKTFKNAAFMPCGSCRKNCTNNSIYCDCCKVWFHAECENISAHFGLFTSKENIPYLCKACFSTEIGTSEYSYSLGLSRLRQVCIYKWFVCKKVVCQHLSNRCTMLRSELCWIHGEGTLKCDCLLFGV